MKGGLDHTKNRILQTLIPCVYLCMFALACDNAFVPFAGETAESPFYLFGYLDTESDTQYVRVQAVRAAYELPASDASNMRVVSVSDHSVHAASWLKRLVVLDDGSHGNVYYATFRAEPGATYRVDVTRDDGATSSSTTTIPARPQPRVDSVRVTDGSVTQRILWTGAERHPQLARITYLVSRASQNESIRVEIDYRQTGRMELDGYAVSLDLSLDQQTIERRTGATQADPVALYGVEMTIRIPSEEWLEPLDNHVENGTGFLGAIATFRTHWVIPGYVVSLLSMEDRQEPAEEVHAGYPRRL